MSQHQLQQTDPELWDLLLAEEKSQQEKIRLIASENYASAAVMAATGTVLTNKYSEGYPGHRYYEGQQFIDQIERLAIDRAKSLFGAEAANVQPYSGTPANLAVYLAFCQPGDTILGMGLPHGGHLSHGWNVSITGRYFNAVHYGVRADDHLVDMDQVRQLALEHRPKLIWAGFSSYPRVLDWAAFGAIAKEVDALLVADMAHISGLVAAGVYPSPVAAADVVTTTTHKTLRGPRGGMILCRKQHRKAINSAVFPGVQGGPHNHTTAAIAVALKEAASDDFRRYAQQIVDNAQAMAEAFVDKGYSLVSGGTDNHLLVVDVTKNTTVSGKPAAQILDRAGMVCSANTVPFDPRKPFDPSGIRIGTPAVTSRGMREAEMRQIVDWTDQVLQHPTDEALQDRIAGQVAELCRSFPAPGIPQR